MWIWIISGIYHGGRGAVAGAVIGALLTAKDGLIFDPEGEVILRFDPKGAVIGAGIWFIIGFGYGVTL